MPRFQDKIWADEWYRYLKRTIYCFKKGLLVLQDADCSRGTDEGDKGFRYEELKVFTRRTGVSHAHVLSYDN